jgi:hypothetical protein
LPILGSPDKKENATQTVWAVTSNGEERTSAASIRKMSRFKDMRGGLMPPTMGGRNQ